MLLDARLRNGMTHAAEDARAAAEVGFDGAWNAENQHDAFLPMALAADATDHIQVGTSVAIAFARSPMTVAYTAHDLHRFSEGRFLLGLGSQIRPHIEKRFGMPWSRPAARMREFVLALRAIWQSWEDGSRLDFRGEFYNHTLMPPYFSPGPSGHGQPKVYLAAVGPLMTEVTGEVADGMLTHSFTTERFLREVTLPAIARGRTRGNRVDTRFEIGHSAFVALDESDVANVRNQIAFYGSTPAYKPVLDLHGWGDAHHEWNRLSKEGRWDDMARLVDDDLLAAMAVVGTAAEVAIELKRRFGDIVDRLRFNIPGDTPSPTRFAGLVDAMRA